MIQRLRTARATLARSVPSPRARRRATVGRRPAIEAMPARLLPAAAVGAVPAAPADAIVTGQLAPSSDTGAPGDAITADPFPTFAGKAPPYAVVLLSGRRLDDKQETLLGRVVAESNGNWQITAGPLPDGSYVIGATTSIPAGDVQPTILYGAVKPLVIDTRAPVVEAVQGGPDRHSARVYFRPDAAGIDPATLGNPLEYSLRCGRSLRPARSVTVEPPASGFTAVTVRFGARLRHSSRLAISGVRDLAGNAVAGLFRVALPHHPRRRHPRSR